MLLWNGMDIRVDVGSIVGHNDVFHWAQTIKTRYVYGVVEVIDQGGNASTKGLSIIKKITDCCAGGVPGASAFRETLTSVNDPTISLILLVLAGNTAIMYVKGSGYSYIKRNGTLARLLNAEGQVEGSIRKGDMFLLMTKNLGNIADESLVMTVFDHLPAKDVAEKLTTKIWMSAQGKWYAGIVVAVTDCIDEGAPEIEPVPEEDIRKNIGATEGMSRRNVRSWESYIAFTKKYWRRFSHKLEDRTTRILVGIVILIMFCIGVGVYREISNRTSGEVLSNIKKGEEKIAEGDALLSMSPVKAKVAFEEGKQFLSQAEKNVSPKSKDGRKVVELLKNLNEKLGQAARVFDVIPTLYFDVSLLKSGGSITTIALQEDTLVALDRPASTVYSIATQSKNGVVIGGPEYASTAITSTLYGDIAYVLTDSGINAITMKTKSGVGGVIKKAPEWGDIRDMVAFGGNVYLLDVGKSRIWKYVASDAPVSSGSASTRGTPGMTFTEMREYLNPDVFPDLSLSTSLSIDGFVWLGGSGGAVRKFVSGREETFTLSGVEPPLTDETRIFTDDTLTHLYILEAKAKRIVVTDKDGIYTAQYRFPDSFTPTSLAVSEKHGIILLLSEGKLYGIPIK
jgi:hypothetical protein